MYQQESGVKEYNIANVCNRLVRQGYEIVQILPNFSITTTYVIIYRN